MAHRRSSARRLIPALLATLGAVLLAPVAVLAHPLGNFTVNRFSRLEVEVTGVQVLHVLDIAEIPAVQEQQVADTDRDGQISDSEWNAWKVRKVEEVRRGLELTIDGRPAVLQLEESRVSTSPGQANLPLIRLEATFRAPWSGGGEHRATFRDRNEPARIGWRELVVRAGPGTAVAQASAPAESISDALRTYPEDLLQSPLDQRQADWTFTASGTDAAPGGVALSFAPAATDAAGRAVDPFTSLVTAAELSPGVVLLALLAAAMLGGIHGASPGHGKTVMAAYIIGTRGTFVQALVLAGSVTFSHTFGVLVLGAVVLFASNTIVPEELYPWLTLVSGLIVVAIGVGLLAPAILGRLPWRTTQRPHEHGHLDHSHEHGDGPGQHRHDLPLTWRNLFALGLAGGIVPSASALVVLLSAVALGRLGFGLLLIVAFGVGMGVVLMAAGCAMVYAGRLLARLLPAGGSPLQRRFTHALPALSGLVMTLAGVAVLVQALGQFGFPPRA